jgi:DNA-binding phage protein
VRRLQKRVRGAPAYGQALLREAVQALLDNDVAVAKVLVRDAIKATIGYRRLAQQTGIVAPSLARMFGPTGNPTAANLFKVLQHLQRRSQVRFEVRKVPRLRASRAARGRSRRA